MDRATTQKKKKKRRRRKRRMDRTMSARMVAAM